MNAITTTTDRRKKLAESLAVMITTNYVLATHLRDKLEMLDGKWTPEREQKLQHDLAELIERRLREEER